MHHRYIIAANNSKFAYKETQYREIAAGIPASARVRSRVCADACVQSRMRSGGAHQCRLCLHMDWIGHGCSNHLDSRYNLINIGLLRRFYDIVGGICL